MTEMFYNEQTNSVDIAQKSLNFYEIAGIVEALIFAAPEPLSARVILEVVNSKNPDINLYDVQDALAYLETTYQDPKRELGRGFELVRSSDAYSFRTVAYVSEYVQNYIQEKPQKLSPAQLEVLAIISYRQPITKFMIEEIRGVDCSSSIKRLLTLKLIKILGKAEGLGKPLLYGTSKEFLELFALNSLRDLPTLTEYRELDKDEDQSPHEDAQKVSIQDLFDPGDTMHSASALKASAEALAGLDRALHRINSASKQVIIEELDNPSSINE